MWVLLAFVVSGHNLVAGVGVKVRPAFVGVVSTYDTADLCHKSALKLGHGWGGVCLPMSSKPQG